VNDFRGCRKLAASNKHGLLGTQKTALKEHDFTACGKTWVFVVRRERGASASEETNE
jgi:hypothetical protein